MNERDYISGFSVINRILTKGPANHLDLLDNWIASEKAKEAKLKEKIRQDLINECGDFLSEEELDLAVQNEFIYQDGEEDDDVLFI